MTRDSHPSSRKPPITAHPGPRGVHGQSLPQTWRPESGGSAVLGRRVHSPAAWCLRFGAEPQADEGLLEATAQPPALTAKDRGSRERSVVESASKQRPGGHGPHETEGPLDLALTSTWGISSPCSQAQEMPEGQGRREHLTPDFQAACHWMGRLDVRAARAPLHSPSPDPDSWSEPASAREHLPSTRRHAAASVWGFSSPLHGAAGRPVSCPRPSLSSWPFSCLVLESRGSGWHRDEAVDLRESMCQKSARVLNGAGARLPWFPKEGLASSGS